jgi:hypothetical protein
MHWNSQVAKLCGIVGKVIFAASLDNINYNQTSNRNGSVQFKKHDYAIGQQIQRHSLSPFLEAQHLQIAWPDLFVRGPEFLTWDQISSGKLEGHTCQLAVMVRFINSLSAFRYGGHCLDMRQIGL